MILIFWQPKSTKILSPCLTCVRWDIATLRWRLVNEPHITTNFVRETMECLAENSKVVKIVNRYLNDPTMTIDLFPLFAKRQFTFGVTKNRIINKGLG